MSAPDAAKRAAAERALEYVSPQMKLGLGTGSTAAWLVELLGERARAGGFGGVCVPTSARTAALAEAAGLRLEALNDVGRLDLTIDGADEFDPDLNLIKGGGGALLQEKIVAAASDRMIVIADASKAVNTLGAFPLPVEIVRFGWRATIGKIEASLAGVDVDGRRAALRMEGDAPFVTDEGHHVVDLHLGRIGDPDRLATALTMIPGVVETGLFIGMAAAAVVGREDGRAEVVGPRRTA